MELLFKRKMEDEDSRVSDAKPPIFPRSTPIYVPIGDVIKQMRRRSCSESSISWNSRTSSDSDTNYYEEIVELRSRFQQGIDRHKTPSPHEYSLEDIFFLHNSIKKSTSSSSSSPDKENDRNDIEPRKRRSNSCRSSYSSPCFYFTPKIKKRPTSMGNIQPLLLV